MQHWQKDRNYRKFENQDGSLTHVIRVDGMDVEVSAEVFGSYSKADRRERYEQERDVGWILSLERLTETSMPLKRMEEQQIESAEDTALRLMETEQLKRALSLLEADESELIESLFFDGIPVRELAREKGVYHRTITYRRDKILKKLQQLLNE